MATIVMDIDGCEIAHEALLLKEFGEETRYAGQDTHPMLAGEYNVAKAGRHNRGHSSNLKVALPSASEDVLDSVKYLLSSAFPKCP